MRPLVWVKPYSGTKSLLPAFQWKQRRKPRNKWTQLSSGQLILRSFLTFKFHFNNLWCGCLHLTQDVSAKWKVSQFMRTNSLSASSFVRHRLIYHSRKTQRTSRYIEARAIIQLWRWTCSSVIVKLKSNNDVVTRKSVGKNFCRNLFTFISFSFTYFPSANFFFASAFKLFSN